MPPGPSKTRSGEMLAASPFAQLLQFTCPSLAAVTNFARKIIPIQKKVFGEKFGQFDLMFGKRSGRRRMRIKSGGEWLWIFVCTAKARK